MRWHSARLPGRRTQSRPARAALLVAGLLALCLAGLVGALGLTGHSGASALAAGAGQPPTAGDRFTPELGLPAGDVVAIGASPREAPGEVWAYGALPGAPLSVGGHEYSSQYTLLEHTPTGGWQVLPLPPGPEGKPLAAPMGGALAGEATAAGGVALLLSDQSIVVREPGGQPRLTPAPRTIDSPSPGRNEVLAAGESLATLPYAAIEDADGHTGVLLAPANDGGKRNSAGESESKPGVLHYDGGSETWTREPIELAKEQKDGFAALALACGDTSSPSASSSAPAASSPRSCWLLAAYHAGAGGTEANRLALFRRVVAHENSAGYAWEPVQVAGGLLGEQSQTPVKPLSVGAQMLTATAQGVWIDLLAAVNPRSPGGGVVYSDVSELAIPASATEAEVLGPWCYPTGAACGERTLGGPLPAHYRSFATPAVATSGEAGARVITGLGERAMLELAQGGASFSEVAGAGGGEAGQAPGAAALYSPGEGESWEGLIADGANSASAADGEGQSQAVMVAPDGAGDQLGEESVPFRRPLLAVTQAPGTTPGDPSAPALAVGLEGQIARYTPGEGWHPEALYNAAGQAQPLTLRGVAWPEPNRAYAVGDNGTMLVWRAETGLWESDPAKPVDFVGNLTAIAMTPGESQLGYAVGKQGVLLKYGKSWEQVPLPPELQQANFTSVAFAGSEAIASYRVLERVPGSQDEFTETGGLAVEEDGASPEAGEHWHVDPNAGALLARLPVDERVLSRVAGLPDGGAVAAGPAAVIERDSPTSEWRFSPQPLPETQNVSALAAYREPSSGAVRAVISIDLDEWLGPEYFSGLHLENGPFKVDLPPPAAPRQPAPFLSPDPLPNSGYVLKQTAGGWQDMEHMALPAAGLSNGESDMPMRPDPALALLVAPDGSRGLAVGGQTENLEGRGLSPELVPDNVQSQTAAAMRFPASAASTDGAAGAAPVSAPAGQASFVLAGQAACAQACADLVNEGLGPEAWLTHALSSANEMAKASPGGALRAFLYTGSQGGEDVFARDTAGYGGSLPAYGPASGAGAPAGAAHNLSGSYAYASEGAGGEGKVRVIVLDEAAGLSAQLSWLEEELDGAKEHKSERGEPEPEPAIVVGNAAPGEPLSQVLLSGDASAYFYDSSGIDVKTLIGSGTSAIPAFGTGTLGYVTPANELIETDSLGSSGFLLASVAPPTLAYCRARDLAANCNLAPVTVEVIPNISSLALDATNGVLLPRSEVALFEALARRPLAGVSVKQGAGGAEVAGPDPYDRIPLNCLGANCADEVPTNYTFTSSRPDIANFVEHEAASQNPRQVQLGPNKRPIADSHSGLLCAYNEGTTIISIATGGLTYSEPVTVRGGSVEYPCGTVPLKNPPPALGSPHVAFSPSLAPSGSPQASPQIKSVPPPPPPPVAPHLHHHPLPHKPVPIQPFLATTAGLALLPPALLPVPPSVARPSPPSGTSSAQVYQSAVAPESEREKEEAIDLVHHMAAYGPEPEGHGTEPGRPVPAYLPAVILLLALSGAGIRGVRGRGAYVWIRARNRGSA